MPNISSLLNVSSKAKALGNLVVVAPHDTGSYQAQLPDVDGIGAAILQHLQSPPKLVFHYEGEQSATLESDITDHFVEDNTARQDQIALKPELITVHGFIGELNDVAPFGSEVFKTIKDKLNIINEYAPALTTSAEILAGQAFAAYQFSANAATAAVSAWSALDDVTGGAIGAPDLIKNLSRNKQQVMFQTFYGYWSSRTLFTVQTPWAIFENMAIRNLRAIQDAETRMISDFEITFKKIRTAQTQTDAEIALGRAAAMASPLQDNGTITPSGDGTNFLDATAKAAGGGG